MLIDNGAEVNAKGNYDLTPLHMAASRNSAEVAKLLIDKGAEVNAQDAGGNSPLDLAMGRVVEGKNTEAVAKVLTANGAMD